MQIISTHIQILSCYTLSNLNHITCAQPYFQVLDTIRQQFDLGPVFPSVFMQRSSLTWLWHKQKLCCISLRWKAPRHSASRWSYNCQHEQVWYNEHMIMMINVWWKEEKLILAVGWEEEEVKRDTRASRTTGEASRPPVKLRPDTFGVRLPSLLSLSWLLFISIYTVY